MAGGLKSDQVDMGRHWRTVSFMRWLTLRPTLGALHTRPVVAVWSWSTATEPFFSDIS